MFKKALIAFAMMIAGPAFVSAQDLFWSFSPTELSSTSSGQAGDSGSAYIFSDALFSLDALDLDFSTSSSCVRFTGVEVFNPSFVIGQRWDATVSTIDTERGSGNLLLISVLGHTSRGFPRRCPPTAFCPSPFLDPGFEENVGPNGAFALARVDFDIVGAGGAVNLELALGTQGALRLPNIELDPSFGSATLNLQPATPTLFGDVNLDDVVDFFDIAAFISVLSTGEFQLEADCNQDCKVDFLDIASFAAVLSGGIVGM